MFKTKNSFCTLLLLVGIFLSAKAFDFNTSPLGYYLHCDLKTNDSNNTLDKIELAKADAYLFIIGPVFGMFANFFVIFAFLKYKAVRKEPGSLVLCISITEFIACVSWICSGIYYF